MYRFAVLDVGLLPRSEDIVALDILNGRGASVMVLG